MGGYLDAYGVADAKRERRVKKIVVVGLAVVIIGLAGYFLFRNWPEERTMNRFFGLLKSKDYQQAYQVWGCTPDHPCRYYPADKFVEDWGPSGVYANTAALHVEDEDVCEGGVVFHLTYPNSDDFGLYVSRSSQEISFAPWPRCPGRHLQIMRFLKSHF